MSYPFASPKPYGHQIDGLRHVAKNKGVAALVMDPGTGKTRVALDYLGLLAHSSGREVKAVVAVPKVGLDTWVEQAQEYLPEHIGLHAEVVEGSMREKAATVAKRGSGDFKGGLKRSTYLETRGNGKGARVTLLVLGLEGLGRRDRVGSKTMADVWVDSIKKFAPHVFIVDESHKIKGAGANASRLMARIGKHVKRRLILTGTVAPHSPLDIYGQWRFLDPLAFSYRDKTGTVRPMPLTMFKERYAILGGWMGKQVVGFCNTPDAPIWMRDGTFKPLGEIEVGDSLMGWAPVEKPVKGGSRRVYAESKVLGVQSRWAENVVEVELSSGAVIKCTSDHKWLRVNPKDTEDTWTTVIKPPYHKFRGRNDLARVVEVPRELSQQERESAAWLAGFYDGEGHGLAFSQSAEHNPDVCVRLEQELKNLGFDYGITVSEGKSSTFFIKGGQQEYVKMLNWLPITRRRVLTDLLHWSRSSRYKKGQEEPKRLHKTRESVVRVTPLPPQQVISMQTTTGNYVAWGLASKNCNLDEMNQIMAERQFVVKKEDALDLPATQDVTINVHLSPKERKAYDEMKTDLGTALKAGTLSTVTSRLTQGLRLRQITAGFLPSDDGEMHQIGTSKLDTIAGLIDGTLAGEDRLVVFSYFRPEIEHLTELLRAANKGDKRTEVLKITGDTPNADRVAYRKRFGSDEDKRIILVAQIKTLSLAVNELVTASNAIFASLSQQRDDYVQARDRLNRIGQKRPVTFWHVLAPGTVDQVILKAHRERGNLERALTAHITPTEGITSWN